jgi:probable phosphoglycerate mutase
MKKIYFVRHGATGGNEKNQFQHITTPLSDMGLKQAEFVASRFESIPVDVVVGSTMTRASQTAEAIAKTVKKEMIASDLFQEILRPTVVRGRSKQDPEVASIMQSVKENFEQEDWHHSDEENFFDLKKRAVKALEFISSLQHENIVVVTHGNFLVMLLMVMGFRQNLTPKVYKDMRQFFVLKNTGITIVDEHEGQYFLITLNDFAHLGDTDITFIYGHQEA